MYSSKRSSSALRICAKRMRIGGNFSDTCNQYGWKLKIMTTAGERYYDCVGLPRWDGRVGRRLAIATIGSAALTSYSSFLRTSELIWVWSKWLIPSFWQWQPRLDWIELFVVRQRRVSFDVLLICSNLASNSVMFQDKAVTEMPRLDTHWHVTLHGSCWASIVPYWVLSTPHRSRHL